MGQRHDPLEQRVTDKPFTDDLLRAVVENLPVGVAIFTAHHTLRLHNTRFIALTGMPTEGVGPGTSVDSWLDKMQYSAEYGNFDGADFLSALRAWNRLQKLSLRRKRGNGQMIDSAYHPLPDGGFAITITDVSDLANGDDTVRRTVTGLAAVLEHVPHGICVYGPDRRVSLFNAAYSRVMEGAPVAIGDHADDITRRRMESGEFGPPGQAEIYAEVTISGINTGSSKARRRLRPNGTMIDIRTALLPFGGYISVVTDITLQMKAEAEASIRAAQMETMLSSIRHGIVMWDPGERVVAANRMAAELLGIDADDLRPGQSRPDVLIAMSARGAFGDAATTQTMVQEILDCDRNQKGERTIQLASGRMIEARYDPAPSGGDISTFTDVTEVRKAENDLRRAKEAAEAANQAKSRFLAAMSHELRTPLNAVIGFSEQLMSRTLSAGDTAGASAPRQITEFAAEINTAGRQLLEQINTVLDVARIDSNSFSLADEPVDLRVVIEVSVRQAVVAAKSAGIGVALDVSENLPAFRGDARRLAQALNHLLSNAVKFSDPGGSIRVRAWIEESGDLLVSVRDNGIGIAAADLQRVLEPFTQLEGTLSRRFQGAGLGLYVSRALIEAHDGTLSLSSCPGAGTIAEIRLPRARLEPMSPVLAASAPPKETT